MKCVACDSDNLIVTVMVQRVQYMSPTRLWRKICKHESCPDCKATLNTQRWIKPKK